MGGWEQLLAPTLEESRFDGIAIGLVTSNEDPDGLGRVKVKFPWLSDKETSHWARIATPSAGNERGIFFLPEVHDEVLVGFAHGMMDQPYILGSLWNGVDKPPVAKAESTKVRMIKSTSGHVVKLDDTEDAEKIEIIDKKGTNIITIDSATDSITIQAAADITIQASDGKLVLSGKGVEINSQAAVAITADQGMDIKAAQTLNIKGQTVNIN